jgi:hypothetical protein
MINLLDEILDLPQEVKDLVVDLLLGFFSIMFPTLWNN